MNIHSDAYTQNLKNTIDKLTEGYKVLQELPEVEVATTPKELVWSKDKIKLYHYKNDNKIKAKIPTIISFAMINRHDVLDIQPDRSLIKKLLEEGLDIYIMDWGYHTRADKYITMEDYILGYYNDAVDYIRKTTGHDKINMQGICQGGTFSMIYCSLFPEKINSLVTYVAPYDFDVRENMLFKWTQYIDIDTMVDSVGTVTGEMIDSAFTLLKPSMNVSKYLGIMNSLDDEEKLKSFLRMEKWKVDLPAIPGEMYRKYIKDLFRDNKLIKGEFEIGGQIVNLKNMTVPFLNVYALQDNIIPNDSTKAIMPKIGSTDKTEIPFPGGHIGVFVGGKSQKDLAPAVAKWTIQRS